MIHDRRLALGFRLTGLFLACAGVLPSLKLFSGNINFSSLMYYTTQSNVLAGILFAMLVVRTWQGLRKDGEYGSASYFTRFEMVCVVDILLTLIVYWALLAPRSFSMDGNSAMWAFSNLSVHLYTPLMCLLDYILFADSQRLKYRDVYYVVIYPLCYVAFASVAGLLGHVYKQGDGTFKRFPYFFFDYDDVGWWSLVYISCLVIFFLILSHVFYLIDRKVTKVVFCPGGLRKQNF